MGYKHTCYYSVGDESCRELGEWLDTGSNDGLLLRPNDTPDRVMHRCSLRQLLNTEGAMRGVSV